MRSVIFFKGNLVNDGINSMNGDVNAHSHISRPVIPAQLCDPVQLDLICE